MQFPDLFLPSRAPGSPRRFDAFDPITSAPSCLLALTLFVSVFLGASSGFALDRGFDPKSFGDEDVQTVEEMAAFPSAARRAALIVAGYPEELMEIQKIQQKSANDFAALLDSYPRETQERVWNLVRYRGLAKDLGRGGRKSKKDLERIAEQYPSEDRDAIVEEGRDRYPLWVQIYALDLEVEQSFYATLSPLPTEPTDVQAAFDELTKNPDLASLLIDNMHLTTVLGAAYRDDPAGVEAHLDARHYEVIARRNQQEREWAEEVADPEAAEELAFAARTFAEEYEYEIEEPTTTVHVTHYVNVRPYPYWFGYPYWYDVAYWYPRPVWGHVGFYFGYGSGYVSVGLPSPLFLGWYHYSYQPRHYAGYYNHHGHSSHRTVHYYDRHSPYYSDGRLRHHDSGVRRAHYDPRRRNSVGTRHASYRDRSIDRQGDTRQRTRTDGRRADRRAPDDRQIDRVSSRDGRTQTRRDDDVRSQGDPRETRRRDDTQARRGERTRVRRDESGTTRARDTRRDESGSTRARDTRRDAPRVRRDSSADPRRRDDSTARQATPDRLRVATPGAAGTVTKREKSPNSSGSSIDRESRTDSGSARASRGSTRSSDRNRDRSSARKQERKQTPRVTRANSPPTAKAPRIQADRRVSKPKPSSKASARSDRRGSGRSQSRAMAQAPPAPKMRSSGGGGNRGGAKRNASRGGGGGGGGRNQGGRR
jgi:hypothetical protein